MVRGIERTAIFRDDADRADLMARLAALTERGALIVYAWALWPTHAHPLADGHAPVTAQHADPPHGVCRGLQSLRGMGAEPPEAACAASGGGESGM